MPDVAFVVPSGHSRLGDLARVLRAELERQGMRTSEHTRYPPPALDRVYVSVDPGRALECDGTAALPDSTILPRLVVLDAAGMPDAPPVPERLLRDAGRVFDISQSAVSALHARGIAGRLLRPGWSPEWDVFDPDATREIGLAVFDRGAARREAVLSDGAEVLARHRGHVQLPPEVDGEERRAVFARARVALLVHSGPDSRLDWLAAMDAIHAGAVVLTEQASEMVPFEAGRDMFAGSSHALPWLAEQLLADPERLRVTRDAAHTRLRSWLPFSVSVGIFRAALLELLGAPLSEANPDAAWREGDDDASVIVRELRRTHEDLDGMRRQIDHLRSAVGSSAVKREPAAALTAAAWDAAEHPVLAVLLTAGDDPADTIATLDSVLQCEPAPEIALVWPLEPDEAVLSWLEERPDAPIATFRGAGGLADVRNAALDLIRAPALLVVDAGVRLMPRAFPTLLARLDEDPPPMSVSALQAVRGDGMSSLVQQPTAPLLTTTSRLREAGGFVGRSPHESVADDEVWSRLAGTRTLVPEILSVRPAPLSTGALAD